jgi:DNA mismatch endonuclease (patch repair protein)
MADIVDRQTRSRMMSGIRSKNTKPELIIRKLLHGMGFRFRIHVHTLPGKPDIVLARYHAVIFIHGCFWHGHKCPLFKLPSTRVDFWKNKIEQNQQNDIKVQAILFSLGWRIATVWECSFRGSKISPEEIAMRLCLWLKSDSEKLELQR